jgi:hypothetical protein
MHYRISAIQASLHRRNHVGIVEKVYARIRARWFVRRMNSTDRRNPR